MSASIFNTAELRQNLRAIAACREFLSIDSSKRFLFGATPYAAGIATCFDVAGIIDDRIDASEVYGLPVLRTVDVPAYSAVVSTVLGRPKAAAQCLNAMAVTWCDYFSFFHYCGKALPYARFWTGFSQAVDRNLSRFLAVRDRLDDAESLEVFDAIISFRLTANLIYLNNFVDRQHQQYFEPFLKLQAYNEVFTDAGGFDGATSEDFMRLCPSFESVFIFEPDPANIAMLKNNIATKDRVYIEAVGLGDLYGTAAFTSSGSTSGISDDGEVQIPIRTLDSFQLHRVTYLKMDIEGAELAAVRGARETILRCHPRLAICVYHQPDDLWTIPAEVMSIRDDYSVFLRHYTEGVTETVMYFLPRS